MDKSALQKELVKMLGKDKVLYDELDLMYYSYDSSFLTKLEPANPWAVVMPHSTEEVQQIMKLAFDNNIDIIPRGAGTGETGGCVLPGTHAKAGRADLTTPRQVGTLPSPPAN